MGDHTPGDWFIVEYEGGALAVHSSDENRVCFMAIAGSYGDPGKIAADANLIAAAPKLYEAAVLLEEAEDAWSNCPNCEGELMPELCEDCMPLFDNARLARRAALAKTKGEPRAQ